MQLLINKIIGSGVMLGLFTLPPFLWWVIAVREKEDFWQWLGLKRISLSSRKSVFMRTLLASIVFSIASFFLLYWGIGAKENAVSEFSGKGLMVLPAVLVFALFNTALPEEILFRGFLLKCLSRKFGFATGNLLQAAIFGMIHGLMFYRMVGIGKALLLTLFTGLGAAFMGYLNEKKGEGSILPSWGMHAFSNAFAGIIAIFSLI
ncbi:CPBP family intramembrane metalloprotease [Clostridiales bacterium COT073_COT-073]|nr:CPBP family intramembrane metalloprotease [Clostridiales bacterium COT073_COT-073]